MTTNNLEKHINKVVGVLFTYLMIHMYYMTNLITNHDDVVTRYYGYYDQTYLGRWLLYYINKITFYTLNSNWTVGLLSAICYCIGILLIIKLLGFSQKYTFWCAVAIMVSFPSMCSWNLYAWMGLGFSIGFLLAIIAAYIISTTEYSSSLIKKLTRCLFSSILLCFSMGCYQAFTSIYIVLAYIFVLYLIFDKNLKNIKLPLFYVAYSVITLLIGYFLYDLTLDYIVSIKNIELTTYQGIGEIGNITLKGLFTGFVDSYINWWKFYFQYAYDLFMLKIVNIILICSLILCWVIKFIQSGKFVWKKILILLLILLFPCIINNIYILTQGNSYVYSCMYFTYVFPYVFLLKEVECLKLDKFKKSLLSLSILLCFLNFLIVNRAYSNQEAVLNNLQQYFNRVAMRIESVEGFTPNTKIFYSNPISLTEYPAFQANNLDTSDSLIGMIYNDSGVHSFMQYYCGFQADNIQGDNSLQQKILNSEAYQQMGVYPADDSIQFIDDVLVIKFK